MKQHIFGVIFCMSSVQSDFSDVSPKLREVCEVMSPHLLFMLTQPLANDYKVRGVAAAAAAAGRRPGTRARVDQEALNEHPANIREQAA